MASNLKSVSDMLKAFDVMSVKELNRIKKHVEKVIARKSPEDRKFIGSLDVNKFVNFFPNYLDNSEINGINSDLQKCGKFNDCNSGTKSMWLSNTLLPYSWESFTSGKTITKQASPISDFKHIEKLLCRINSSMKTDLNSCLIQYYPTGSSSIRLHDDFEFEMDQSEPFVVISVGETRNVEFFHNYQKPSEVPIRTISAEQGSMYTMNSNCQNFFRHRVPAAGYQSGCRYSLSFRRILNLEDSSLIIDPSEASNNNKIPTCSFTHTPRKLPSAPAHSNVTPSAPEMSPIAPLTPSAPPLSLRLSPSAPPLSQSMQLDEEHPIISQPLQNNNLSHSPKNVTVLFGTSITKRMNPDLISNTDCEFINVSVSGAKLVNHNRSSNVPDMATIVKEFSDSHPTKVPNVNRVIFSVGTNDIKFLKNKQIGPFRRHICDLVHLSRRLFGKHVQICFQSVLPMRVMYTYTVSNFINFNLLLKSICYNYDCTFLDWFDNFLDFERRDIDRSLYVDSVHLNRNGLYILNNLFDQLCKYEVDVGRSHNY